MRTLSELLGVDLAEALSEGSNLGCAKELQFDNDNSFGFDDTVVGGGYEEEVEDGMEMEYEDGGVSGGGENVGGSSVVTPKRKVLVDTFVGEEEELEPPAISMVFGSWDVVDSYFWRYARQKGFGIVRAASSWAKVKSELGDGKFCKHRRNAK
uniref:Uncharacterized protein n=1 Tax=Chenopodium quinoa TaxID=63459 RepID=A0A803L9Y4_CHEQI